jgi:omega-amidase
MQLTISLAQIHVALGDLETNLKRADEWTAEAARRGSDLIVFPEMWTTGLAWNNVKSLSAGQDEVLKAVAGLAKKYGLWLNGSMLALDDDSQPANTSILFDPQGQPSGIYRKIHLFGLMNEDQYLAPGQPEIFRAYALGGVNMIYLPSAWPHPRLAHWRTLLRARAIENQMYIIATNQVGSDGAYHFCGHSAIIDPWGEIVVEAGETEVLLTATIETERVAEARQKIPVFKDRRPELYQLDKEQ